MKLYYAKGSCSLSPHIVLLESGLSFITESVDLRSKKTASGDDFLTINPKGQVPVLQLDNGMLLTEGVAIIQYIADLAADKKLIPLSGCFERYQAIEWLNFLASEIHKGYAPLFTPGTPKDYYQSSQAKLVEKFNYIDSVLAKFTYLLGDNFSVADAYLFTMLGWNQHVGVNIDHCDNINRYRQVIAQRPSVIAAIKAEA